MYIVPKILEISTNSISHINSIALFFETIADKLSQNVNVAVQLRPFIFTIFIIIFALKEKQNMRNICIRSSLKVMSISRKQKIYYFITMNTAQYPYLYFVK